jgi:hypothetical protein
VTVAPALVKNRRNHVLFDVAFPLLLVEGEVAIARVGLD